jgi:hypothetical protein
VNQENMKIQIFTKILVASLVALWLLWLNNASADELDQVVDYLIASEEQELELAAGQEAKGDAGNAKTAGSQQSAQTQDTAEVVVLWGAANSSSATMPANKPVQKDKKAQSR